MIRENAKSCTELEEIKQVAKSKTAGRENKNGANHNISLKHFCSDVLWEIRKCNNTYIDKSIHSTIYNPYMHITYIALVRVQGD